MSAQLYGPIALDLGDGPVAATYGRDEDGRPFARLVFGEGSQTVAISVTRTPDGTLTHGRWPDMATVAEARPLADLEQDAIARVEEEFARRARGVKPWTPAEYVDRIEQVHIRYNHRRQWLRTHEQETAS